MWKDVPLFGGKVELIYAKRDAGVTQQSQYLAIVIDVIFHITREDDHVM